MAADKKTENPLVNILVNVLIPVMALSYLSKDPAIQEKLGQAVKPWHLGPAKALVIALVLPLGYGLWFFIKNRKANFMSALGLISVLLTGGITLYLWNTDGTVKSTAGLLYGIKEASIPLALSAAILFSHRSPNPLLNVFIYNDTLFDIPRINSRINDENRADYQALMFRSTCLFATSFLISAAINLGLSLYLFIGFKHDAPNALETYNAIVGKITWWSFLVVLVPAFAFLFFTLRKLVAGLKQITGLSDEEVMLAR
jgi:hypothetical protein